ncbi:MAG: 2,4'-dihydroxyacetophenone dioxygenase family protein [Gemmatimonadota bacterium]
MPVTAFPGYDDGLDAVGRQRDHFITALDFDDDRLWIPYGETAWFQPCHFNVTTGGFTAVLKALPGTVVPKHYHVSTVQGYTLQGTWRYLEHDWIASAGTFIFEPAGEAHTLVVPEDATEPMITLFVVSGALVYVDDAGDFVAYEDGFTLLELARQHCREQGLDLARLDALIR